MTVDEFKQDHPEYAHLDGNDLWDAMEQSKLMQQDGEKVLKQIKPFWKRYKFRYLFYGHRYSGFSFQKYSGERCANCKKDYQGFIFMFPDANGKPTRYHSCGKPLVIEPDISLKYRLWRAKMWVLETFRRTLDALHILRLPGYNRYGMFGDEAEYVKSWGYNFETNEIRTILKPRRWWEYLIIKQ
jgi:hypothetical protein